MLTRAALTSEITTDPAGIGYGPFLNVNDQKVADLINQVRPSITVFRNDLRGSEVFGAIVLAEYALLTPANQSFINTMILTPTIDVTSSTIRSNIVAIFGAGTATRANLGGIAQRTGSRAEQLGGTGTVVSELDVANALGRFNAGQG